MGSPRDKTTVENLKEIYESYKPNEQEFQFEMISYINRSNAHLFTKIQSGINDLLEKLNPDIKKLEAKIGELGEIDGFLNDFNAIKNALKEIESSLKYTNQTYRDKGVFELPDTDLHTKIVNVFKELDILAKQIRSFIDKNDKSKTMKNEQVLLAYRMYANLYDVVKQFEKLTSESDEEKQMDENYFDDYGNKEEADKKNSTTMNSPTSTTTTTTTATTTVTTTTTRPRRSPAFFKATTAPTQSMQFLNQDEVFAYAKKVADHWLPAILKNNDTLLAEAISNRKCLIRISKAGAVGAVLKVEGANPIKLQEVTTRNVQYLLKRERLGKKIQGINHIKNDIKDFNGLVGPDLQFDVDKMSVADQIKYGSVIWNIGNDIEEKFKLTKSSDNHLLNEMKTVAFKCFAQEIVQSDILEAKLKTKRQKD